MKKIITALLALSLIFSFAGCRGNSDNSSTNDNTNNSTENYNSNDGNNKADDLIESVMP